MLKNIYLKNILIDIRENLRKIKIRGGSHIPAGYPAEAYNYEEKRLDLNEFITRGKTTIKCVWATNRSMLGEGINYGDLLVIDTSLKMTSGRVGLFWLEDEFLIGRVTFHKDYAEITPLNDLLKKIDIYPDEPFELKGIVTNAIKKFSVYNNHISCMPPDAEMIIQEKMDFTEYLIKWWETTFYLWAKGTSMSGDGIETGDLLIIDNLAEVNEDSILVFAIDKNFTLKRIKQYENYNELVSSNPDIPPIRIKKDDVDKHFGVLTGVIKDFLKQK